MSGPNVHRSIIDKNQTKLCDHCGVMESLEHFLFDCDEYSESRATLKNVVLRVLSEEGIPGGDVDMKILSGNVEDISLDGERQLVEATQSYIKQTGRFLKYFFFPFWVF